MTRPALAGVVLAAGLGTRLRPLTELRPKALVPVDGVPLLDGALARLSPHCGRGPEHLAVNAHHHGGLVGAAAAGRAHVSVEDPVALGTAGALAALAGWLDGRDVLVTNADTWMPAATEALDALVAGWDGERCRLLCAPAAAGAGRDFTTPGGRAVRYLGSCLLPARHLSGLAPEPSGLYEVLWRELDAAGQLDLAVADPSRAVDCGTPADYLRANLLASGGASVVGRGAVVLGTLERSVVWDGAFVGAGEHLVDAVRAGTRRDPVTVRLARPAAPPPASPAAAPPAPRPGG